MITGRIGGGKTYSAAEDICAHLAKGGYCGTNIILNWRAVYLYCLAFYGVKVQRRQLVALKSNQVSRFYAHVPWGHPGLPSKCWIDEAQLWFGPKTKFVGSEGITHETLEFLTQSRKACVDVTFITQAPVNIDMAFAKLALWHWAARDLKGVKMPLIGKYPFPHILKRKFDIESGELLEWKLSKRKNEVFTLYDSFAFLSAVQERNREIKIHLEKWGAAKSKARARLRFHGKKANRVRNNAA